MEKLYLKKAGAGKCLDVLSPIEKSASICSILRIFHLMWANSCLSHIHRLQREHANMILSFFFQFAVLIEVLKPLVLFLILMGIRFRREPDFVPEGKLPVKIH